MDLPADSVLYSIWSCNVDRNKTITKHHPVIQLFHYYDSQVTLWVKSIKVKYGHLKACCTYMYTVCIKGMNHKLCYLVTVALGWEVMQATADGPTARIDPVCVRVRERGATKQNSRTQSSISLWLLTERKTQFWILRMLLCLFIWVIYTDWADAFVVPANEQLATVTWVDHRGRAWASWMEGWGMGGGQDQNIMI